MYPYSSVLKIAFKIDILALLDWIAGDIFIGFLFKCLVAVSYFIQAIFQRSVYLSHEGSQLGLAVNLTLMTLLNPFEVLL